MVCGYFSEVVGLWTCPAASSHRDQTPRQNKSLSDHLVDPVDHEATHLPTERRVCLCLQPQSSTDAAEAEQRVSCADTVSPDLFLFFLF